MGPSRQSIRSKALRLLSRREHSSQELVRKLSRQSRTEDRKESLEQIGRTINELASLDLVSDKRAAEGLLHSSRGRFGILKLTSSLREKGIPLDLAEDVLSRARVEELANAREVWRKRFGSAPQDAKERARQLRFLAGRGFTAEVLSKVFESDFEVS